MRKASVSHMLLVIAIILASLAIVAFIASSRRSRVTIYDPRFELLGVKTSFGTNHGGLPSAGFRRAVRAVGSRFGMQLARTPDDRFTSSEPTYAIVVRYRFPISPAAYERLLGAQLMCGDQIICQIRTVTTRFSGRPRVTPAASLKPQPSEAVACFFLTNALPWTNRYTLRLRYTTNILADIKIDGSPKLARVNN